MVFSRSLACRTEEQWLAMLPTIRRARYGVIETAGGSLQAVHVRRFPKWIALPELWPVAKRYHESGMPDRCLLYFNQPRSCPNFLALKYVASTQATSYATFRAAIATLDALAAEKGIDALVCDAANSRLSDRFLARQGWEKHKPQRWHRNFIKRFYGEYPKITVPVERRSTPLLATNGACYTT
jgi:hypothetical protein